ncbi:PD-(D/E)XK nuclease-like domain-containing protein [Prescottella equi]|uniref:PD-(D/E)XK nuclease-like domain-containing protein n=1 Tax=Rhodococcus hoagii TaxID=43767 RepID=UPI000B3D749C|nr:PD-(D/E)XK nuclease-like domain-containing protein [Prescottella equi]
MSDIVEQIGVYADIPDSVYHSDRGSLSSSGARKLLPPSCPAIFRYEQDHPRESTTAFDLGHAAHTLVLGYGAEIVEVKAGAWSTKAAKEAREQAYAEGKTPLLSKEVAQVHGMAAALKAHPLAAALFADGEPERSMYWRDDETGVMLRMRPDWLPNQSTGRLIVTDYKTSVDSNPDVFGKSAANFCYHQQAAWYLEGLAALGISNDAAFVFVVQSKTPPYLVSVVELHHDALMLGRRLNRRAIDIYADCHANNHWPGWGDDVALVDLPNWAYMKQEEILNV